MPLKHEAVGSTLPLSASAAASTVRFTVMDLTPDEQPVVRRAVAAYHQAKKGHKGPFRGTTAEEILEELKPSPVRWAELAARQLTRRVGMLIGQQNGGTASLGRLST